MIFFLCDNKKCYISLRHTLFFPRKKNEKKSIRFRGLTENLLLKKKSF